MDWLVLWSEVLGLEKVGDFYIGRKLVELAKFGGDVSNGFPRAQCQ